MISHKLNEIEQISDAITILRDGKTIETLAVAEDKVDEDRIIRGMVGRDLEHRFPDHTPEIGDVLLEVRDWTVGPGRRLTEGHQERQPHGPPRGDRRHRRADGRRTYGAGPQHLRPLVRQPHRGPADPRRQGAAPQVGARRDRRRHRVPHGGPQGARAQPARRHQAVRERAGIDQPARAWWSTSARRSSSPSAIAAA